MDGVIATSGIRAGSKNEDCRQILLAELSVALLSFACRAATGEIRSEKNESLSGTCRHAIVRQRGERRPAGLERQCQFPSRQFVYVLRQRLLLRTKQLVGSIRGGTYGTRRHPVRVRELPFLRREYTTGQDARKRAHGKYSGRQLDCNALYRQPELRPRRQYRLLFRGRNDCRRSERVVILLRSIFSGHKDRRL